MKRGKEISSDKKVINLMGNLMNEVFSISNVFIMFIFKKKWFIHFS